jgi:hypothetical protein
LATKAEIAHIVGFLQEPARDRDQDWWSRQTRTALAVGKSLVSGVAVVRLDPTFAASIDPTMAYRVFVTPAGDTRGLFVATRGATGFVVRESQAGRSTVSSPGSVAPVNAAAVESIAKAPLPVTLAPGGRSALRRNTGSRAGTGTPRASDVRR